jgi:hypothetical protein
VKKLIAMLLIAGVCITATVGCGGSTPTSKAPAAPTGGGDKPKP